MPGTTNIIAKPRWSCGNQNFIGIFNASDLQVGPAEYEIIGFENVGLSPAINFAHYLTRCSCCTNFVQD